MPNRTSSLLVALVALTAFSAALHAQAVVHALSGTAKSVGEQSGSLTVVSVDGTHSVFEYAKDTKAATSIEAGLRAATVAPAAFSKSGDQVIVYYFGTPDSPVAIAVDDLGAGPFAKASGTVTRFDRHSRALTLRLSSGTEQTFKIAEKTVADTSEGLVDGRKFNPEKGAVARVIASTTDATNTALFVKTRVD